GDRAAHHGTPGHRTAPTSGGRHVIRHVVTLTLRPDATDAQRSALEEGLDELAATLPTIVEYRHGPDLGLAEGNADWVIVADFEDEDGWRAYAQDPRHLAFIEEVLRPVLAARSASQYHLQPE